MKKLLTILFAVAFGLNLSAQVPDYVPTDGLVAWYPLDGEVTDFGPNELDGVNSGANASQNRFGQAACAMHFDGQSFIQLPSENFPNGLTVSLWVKEDEVSGIHGFLSKYDGDNGAGDNSIERTFNLYRHGGGTAFKYYMTASSSGVENTDVPSISSATTDWVHIAAVFGDETLQFFVNGELDIAHDADLDNGYYESDVPLIVGGGYPPLDDPNKLRGDMDDLGIWGRTLTEEEILGLYNAEPPLSGCTDPTACNFDSEATSDDGSCIYPPFVELGDDIATCEDSVFLDAGEGFTYYEWNTGDTSRSILVQEAGEYSVITSNTLPNEHALQFNGIDASAQFEESILFGVESFSVSVDCRLNAFAGNDSEPYSYIIGHPLTEGTNDHGFKIQTASNSLNGGFQVHINDEGTTHFNVISFDNSVESKVELDQWYDLTMVVDRDNALFSFYVDGVLVEAQTIHSDFGNLDHPNGLSLGIQSIHQTSLLNGYLDNLQVWDIALSEEQVAQFQTTVPSGNEEELVGFWDFEEGEGNEANEVNGSASSILLNNVGWTGDNLHSMFDFSCSAEDSIQVSFLVTGCVNPEACNYAEDALCDDGSCIPSGCMETDACNYNVLAECEGEECDYSCCPGPGCCGEGMFWDYELEQCQIFETCQEDLDGDGVIGINDLMELLSSFGTMCEEPETGEFTCGDPMNYHGYDYATVQIGEQCWFAENLRTELYRNGDLISTEINLNDWINLSSGAQTSYSNDESLAQSHGLLYNWYAVMDSRKICPSGWHEPSNGEWQDLEANLGLDISIIEMEGWRGNVGFQLKNSDTSEMPWNGSNEVSFNGTPSGFRQLSGGSNGFVGLGSRGEYWTTSNAVSDASNKISRSLDTNQEALGMSPNAPNCGFSVRCLKDTE